MNNDELIKRIIKIIGDLCFKESSPTLSNEFSLYLSPLIVKHIEENNFNYGKFKQFAKKRQDFFIANDLDADRFCRLLFAKIKSELSYFTLESFHDELIEFKRRVENGNYRGFPKQSSSEDTLRSALVIYIRQESFCEARSSSGRNDIVVPSERAIIETKIWNGEEYYNAGLPELHDYLDKAGYKEGYYIVFDYNKKENCIIAKNGECFTVAYKGKQIHVIFVLMNRESPSKLYNAAKAKNKQ